ncbi:hypothetical protein K439DRAFT_1658077 [Ramaria rubella]|nr:hypothetical protein K439DRAFT_1658077 [Ramaria rubella]
MFFEAIFALLLTHPVANAAQAPKFVPPSLGPTVASPNYVGRSNVTLPPSPVVHGKQFDRFIQIWLENTDFSTANDSGMKNGCYKATFRSLAKRGILLDQFYALAHPSQPNYVASVGGDFWGMPDDKFYSVPENISTVVDLLEAKHISWASYQESMPTDGFVGGSFLQPNYLDPSAPPYRYYFRKHNPLIIYDSVSTIPERAARHRNFNDFAADINASVIPQWAFITPNIVNDAHDTDIDFASQWLEYWLFPLLDDTRFNNNRTLILLTFDENETYSLNNKVFSVLLGGAVPKCMHGTTDSTYYTHYSLLSTVQANWGLGSLGRGDTNNERVMSNVFSLVAAATGYNILNISGIDIPHTNSFGTTPGPLNHKPGMFTPFSPPNMSAVGAGGGPVFIASRAGSEGLLVQP